jgi:hypothetical protein
LPEVLLLLLLDDMLLSDMLPPDMLPLDVLSMLPMLVAMVSLLEYIVSEAELSAVVLLAALLLLPQAATIRAAPATIERVRILRMKRSP